VNRAGQVWSTSLGSTLLVLRSTADPAVTSQSACSDTDVSHEVLHLLDVSGFQRTGQVSYWHEQPRSRWETYDRWTRVA